MSNVPQAMDEATDFALTDADIERARLLVGIDTARKFREYVTTASYDSIRNFAHGLGDDNPLYCDEDYGNTTRWGSQIAPNIMAAIINAPLRGDGIPPEIKAQTKGVFKGVHVFVSGGSWDWYRPVRPGDRLFSCSGEESLEVKDSTFGGRSVIQVRCDIKFNQRCEIVGVYRVVRILTERKTARERGTNLAIEAATYSDDDIAEIDRAYLAERRRGDEPRFWEDVEIGDELPPMLKGPLTVTEVICFHAGGYGFVPYAPTASRLAAINRARIPGFYVKDEQGIPDVAQRLHWDSQWAKAIGNPMAYDYGVMRECWLHHYATDWAGDDSFVTHQSDSLRKFNYMGDTQYLRGEVTDKHVRDGATCIDLAIHMTNQRGVETSTAEITVSLPSREHGTAVLPSVPTELQQKVDRIWRRHQELVQ